ncbi:MAG: lasso peptide biosynthesis B2 protein [Verrucomicrobiia bacterium]|jgi:hypothetical protein
MPAALNEESRPLRTVLTMSWRDQALHAEAALCLFMAKVLIHTIPFRWLHALIVTQPLTALVVRQPAKGSEIQKVVFAVRTVVRRSPIEFICFPKAVAVKWMLNRRGYANSLCLGVSRPEEELKAHAWVEVCGQTIIGGGESLQYSEVLRLD